MFKMKWEPEEMMKILTICGERVPLNRNHEVIVRKHVAETVITVPLAKYAIESKPVKETIDGREYAVKYFDTGDVHTDTIMCILYLCVPDFKNKSVQRMVHMVEQIHKIFTEADANTLKILSKLDKDTFLENMEKVYTSVEEEPMVSVRGVSSTLLQKLLTDVLVGPSKSVCRVLSSLLSLDELQRVVRESLTPQEILTGCMKDARTKLSQASPCVGEDTSTLEKRMESFLRVVLEKSVEMDDEYPIGLISYKKDCPVVIIDGLDRVRVGPAEGDAHVLYRSKEDAVGIVGEERENGFEAILESSLNL
jgi:hypothetical protein